MAFADIDTITDLAVERWRTLARSERLGTLMASLVRHLHDFARDNALTHEEWFEATEFLTRVGKISNDKRKEFILLSDVLGLSMLVTLQNDSKPPEATQTTLLGPFYIPESPLIASGGLLPGIGPEDGTPLFVEGRVTDLHGRAVADATIDVWQTDHNGIYEAQLLEDEVRHRGLIRPDDDGRYLFRTVEPVDYPVPVDGPVGELLALTAISEYRPAHIHFMVSAPGFEPLVTHMFDRASAKLDSDVVFGTRDTLLVDYERRPGGATPTGGTLDRPFSILRQDFALKAR